MHTYYQQVDARTGAPYATFAVVSEPTNYSEYRLDGTSWTFLPTSPIQGWIIGGDACIDECSFAATGAPVEAPAS